MQNRDGLADHLRAISPEGCSDVEPAGPLGRAKSYGDCIENAPTWLAILRKSAIGWLWRRPAISGGRSGETRDARRHPRTGQQP
jgi:hypothetical protein